MKKILFIFLVTFTLSFSAQISRGNNNQNSANSEEENKELPQKPTNGELYPKMKKVADCNKDLELEQANNLIYHKKTRKPFTGSCVSYYDNQKMERMVSFVMGREDGTSYSYYDNGQVMVMTLWVNGIENGTWGYWYDNGQIAWGNTYDMGEKVGEWGERGSAVGDQHS